MKKEIRSLESTISADGRTLVGYAALFNVESGLINNKFTEVIKPGAFDLERSKDILALRNHNENFVLGRFVAGRENNTLRIEQDERGLKFAIDMPDTPLGNETLESVKRGDITQMSFAFYVIKDEWIQRRNQPRLHVLHKVWIDDISLVPVPAYAETFAFVRSLAAVEQVSLDTVAAVIERGSIANDTEQAEIDKLLNIVESIKTQATDTPAAADTQSPIEKPVEGMSPDDLLRVLQVLEIDYKTNEV